MTQKMAQDPDLQDPDLQDLDLQDLGLQDLDLDACAREPIHIPGSIPCGWMLPGIWIGSRAQESRSRSCAIFCVMGPRTASHA